jgi:hypothetical protein
MPRRASIIITHIFLPESIVPMVDLDVLILACFSHDSLTKVTLLDLSILVSSLRSGSIAIGATLFE